MKVLSFLFNTKHPVLAKLLIFLCFNFFTLQVWSVPYNLSVSANSVTIDVSADNTASVNVTSNIVWSAVSNQSWLTVTSGGSGNGTITFTATNTPDATRQAIVTVSGPGVASINITVTQNWGVNMYKYQYSMTMTSIVKINDVEYAGTDMQIAAFIGDECRGTTVLMCVDEYKRYMAFLMVYGNATDINKPITFKCANQAENVQLTATNLSSLFVPNDISGSSVDPYLINVVQDPINITGVNPVVVSSLSGIIQGSIVSVSSGATLILDKNKNVKSMTVNAGAKLSLNDGFALTTPTLTLQSDPTGVLPNGTFVDKNAGTPTPIIASVQQSLSAGRNWYISSPISGATGNVVLGTVGNKLWQYNEVNSDWTTDATSTSTPLTAMKGFVANTIGGLVTFSGTLNSGNTSITVNRTENGNAKRGYNLVGNPYPSYLNWTMVSAASSNIESTMWYRTMKGSVYEFDTYNAISGIGTNNGITVSQYIPPMQAFWVLVSPTKSSGIVVANNSMRSHDASGTNLLKTRAAINTDQKVLRIQVSNGTNSDETIVLFNPNASNAYDAYDSPKMSNANAAIPEIYTLAGTEQVVINGFRSLTPDIELPLGFTTGKSNTLTLKATEISNFDSNTKIILKDNLLNTQQELTDGSEYNFNSEVTNTTKRFSLMFKTSNVSTDIPQNNEDIPSLTVYGNASGQMVVNFNNEIIGQGNVSVFNTVGKKLESKTLNPITILNGPFMSGVYLVKVSANGKILTKKLKINQ